MAVRDCVLYLDLQLSDCIYLYSHIHWFPSISVHYENELADSVMVSLMDYTIQAIFKCLFMDFHTVWKWIEANGRNKSIYIAKTQQHDLQND